MSETAQLRVRLTPKAAQNKIQGWGEDADGHKVLKISVTTVPEKGKANKALIAFLAKRLKVPKSDISIIRGETDRTKILKINNISGKSLESLL